MSGTLAPQTRATHQQATLFGRRRPGPTRPMVLDLPRGHRERTWSPLCRCRHVSAAVARPPSQTTCRVAPGTGPLPMMHAASCDRAPRHPRRSGLDLCAPDVCSMFARMSRHASVAPGIRGAVPIRTIGRNDSSRHVLARFLATRRVASSATDSWTRRLLM